MGFWFEEAFEPGGEGFAGGAGVAEGGEVGFELVVVGVQPGPVGGGGGGGGGGLGVAAAAAEEDLVEEDEEGGEDAEEEVAAEVALAPADFGEFEVEAPPGVLQPLKGGGALAFFANPRRGGGVEVVPLFLVGIPDEGPGVGVAGADDVAAAGGFVDGVADGVAGGVAELAEEEGGGGGKVFAVAGAGVAEEVAEGGVVGAGGGGGLPGAVGVVVGKVGGDLAEEVGAGSAAELEVGDEGFEGGDFAFGDVEVFVGDDEAVAGPVGGGSEGVGVGPVVVMAAGAVGGAVAGRGIEGGVGVVVGVEDDQSGPDGQDGAGGVAAEEVGGEVFQPADAGGQREQSGGFAFLDAFEFAGDPEGAGVGLVGEEGPVAAVDGDFGDRLEILAGVAREPRRRAIDPVAGFAQIGRHGRAMLWFETDDNPTGSFHAADLAQRGASLGRIEVAAHEA